MTTRKALLGAVTIASAAGILLLGGCATLDSDDMPHDTDWAPAGGHSGHGHHTAIPGVSGVYAAVTSDGEQATN